MSKNILKCLVLVAAMLVAGNSSAIERAIVNAYPNVANGSVRVSEGTEVQLVFSFEGSCSELAKSNLVISPAPEGVKISNCMASETQKGASMVKFTWAAQEGDHVHTVSYPRENPSTAPFAGTFTFVGTPAYDPSAHPSTEEFADHVEDDSMHGGGLKDGSFQILGQIGGMPNDKYTQRPTFLARLLLNATLARARWGGGFKLGLLGGYGETNFRVSPTFASLTEEAPVRIGEWALMPQFTHRPVSWFEWNAGIPLGLRYYSYEAQILSLDPGNPDALENNNRQFAFWTGFYIDAQFVIADYLSVGGFAQFSMNPTKVDVMIGDGQDKGELMPQFAGGAMIGLDL
ncbi:MAG: hypothetical protein R3B71_02260 [Candidatus Gracilibacteria bacterium]